MAITISDARTASTGYVNGRLRQDRIQNLDLRTILGAGVGYEWIKQTGFNVRVEGGLS